MECSRCGISSDRARLLDAISPEGIVKLCEVCADKENFPVVKKPTTDQLKQAEKPVYYGRYARGSNVKETARRIEGFGKPVYGEKDVDVKLKDLVDKNYKENLEKQGSVKPRPDLVDNFHWIIMRARRLRKLTQKELAKEISEAEAAVEMAERGILPEDDYKFVKKLESFLRVNLIKDSARRKLSENREKPARILNINSDNLKELTIDDLKRMKQAREQGFEDRALEQESPKEVHDYSEEIEVSSEDYPEFEEE